MQRLDGVYAYDAGKTSLEVVTNKSNVELFYTCIATIKTL